MAAVEPLPGVKVPPASLQPPDPIFGIDPSTQRMSLAVLLPARSRVYYGPGICKLFAVDTLSLPQRKGAERWAAVQRELVPWLGELIGCWHPSHVFVEQPFAHGRPVPPVSYYVIGVLLAVLGAYRQQVEMIEPQTWKAAAMGKGNGRAKPAEYMRWARSVGYDGGLEDEAAAIGIATAGGVLLEQRLAQRAA